MTHPIDEIEQRRAHAVNKAWVRSMPNEMLARWYKLITDEHARRERIRALDSQSEGIKLSP